MHHFKIFEGYTKKKYKRELAQENIDEIPSVQKDNPIPDLQINNVFRRRTFTDRGGLSKYLLEFDIATQAIFIVAFLLLLGTFIFAPDLTKSLISAVKNPPAGSTAALTAAEQKIRQSVAKKVYANSVPISADRIFSAPPSDITLVAPGIPKREVYGFFPYWMLERESQINFDALTSIGLFGLDVNGEGDIMTGTGDGQPNPGWKMWNDPKLNMVLERAKRKNINVELTFKAFNNNDIENLVLSDEAQKKFIANAIYLIQSKSLGGINIDFEYTGTPEQKVTDGFTRLITNLRAEMKRQSPDSTLTVDTYASAGAVRGLFDIRPLSEQTDSLIIMGYDIHTPSGDSGPVAPLEGQVSILGFLQSYLEKVAPEKLILAVPYYGYDWEQHDKSGASAYMLSYAEIAEMSRDKTIGWDENAKTPYFLYVEPGTGQERVVHFENVRSLGAKYDLINTKNLKGVGIWALGYDGQNADLHNILVEKFAR